VLKTTALPIPNDRYAVAARPCPTHTADYWAEAMRGQNFAQEDRLDTAAFNAALWRGLGTGPEPVVRSGADLRVSRTPAAATSGTCS
jgi:hypothetical protein